MAMESFTYGYEGVQESGHTRWVVHAQGLFTYGYVGVQESSFKRGVVHGQGCLHMDT